MTGVVQLLIALVSGAAITLQGQFMGLLDRTLGTKESVFITYGSGGVRGTLLLLGRRGGDRAAGGCRPSGGDGGDDGRRMVGSSLTAAPVRALRPGLALLSVAVAAVG